MLELSGDQIEPAPKFGNHIRADFIRGMGKLGERLVVLLDVGRVLSADEIALLENASSEHEQGLEQAGLQ